MGNWGQRGRWLPSDPALHTTIIIGRVTSEESGGRLPADLTTKDHPGGLHREQRLCDN